jgi:EmrB/QacA subfamily drug resistance transporter
MSTDFLAFATHKHIPRILGLGLFLQQLDAMILNTAIPQMAHSLNTPALSLKLAITSYLLTLALFIPISGYIADKFGTKRTFSWAMIVFLLGSVICGLAMNIEILIFGRLVQGAGAAMVAPVGRLILLKAFSRTDFLHAFAAYAIVGQIGLVLGPVLGGIITTFMDWRFIFFVNIPIILLALYWTKKSIPNYIDPENLVKFDWIGFLVFGGAAGAITFGLSWLTEDNFMDHEPWVLFGLGVLLAGIYYFYARRLKYPALDLNVFKIKTFWVTMVGGFGFRISASGVSFLLPLQLQLQFGYSAFMAGLLIFPNVLAFLTARSFFKILLKHYGFKKILLICPIFSALALLGFAFMTKNMPLWCMIILMIVMGMASSVQYGAINTLTFADVPAQDSSRATSVSTVFQQIGLSMAICFCAGLLVINSGFSVSSVMSAMAFHRTYLVLSALTLLSAVVFFKLSHENGAHLLK